MKSSSPSRIQIGANVVIQIACVLVLVFGINYIGFNYYFREDFSRSQEFRLSDQTKRVLRELKGPVKFIVFFSPSSLGPDAALYPDVANLLTEFQFIGKKRVTVEFVDPARNLSRAQELQTKYKFGAAENVVIVDYDDRSKFVPVASMADWTQGNPMMGEPPAVEAFKGEQALTTALIELLHPESRKIYFLQGHGEPELTGASTISLLQDYVARQSLKAEPLTLAGEGVPDDAGVVVILGPRYDVSQAELAELQAYWAKEGSLIVLLDPDAKTPNLHALLRQAGIEPLDTRVLRTVNLGFAVGILRDVTTTFIPDSPVTKRLAGINGLLLGPTQSLQFVPDVVREAGLTVRPLMESLPEFWAETVYVADEESGVKFDEGTDTRGPIMVAASSEKGAVKDENVQLRSSKLVVVGSSDFAEDSALNEPNLDFLLSSFNWMLERTAISGVAPKEVRAFQLSLNDAQMGQIALWTMMIVPGCAAVLGAIVWYRRRR